MNLKFIMLSVLVSVFATATHAAPSQSVFDHIVKQGVPRDALERLVKFMDDFRGRTFNQETYTCDGYSSESVKPCSESDRSNSTTRVTLENPEYVVIIDYGAPSTERRFFYINLRSGIVEKYYVSHGRGSGESNYATKFSNIKNSKQTSLGIYLTGETYDGKYGETLRMYGLQNSNDQAYNRDIVMHGAWYVSEDFINSTNPSTGRDFGRLGLSWGCPALSRTVAERLIPRLKNGSLIMHYHEPLMEASLSGREVKAP
ncbi:murein L,D-transpeptidase catalytic domain family protein [Bdellovibrio sp. HCB337]|uniref:murein L,D-transpeptidase catalytic domain family protein n=1 Tax=Bdellovibrio sp. HCB337 TaxID=3394358 RepID=UPI0039A453CC